MTARGVPATRGFIFVPAFLIGDIPFDPAVWSWSIALWNRLK